MSEIGHERPKVRDVHSFVIMFDVVGFSTRGGSEQADCVEKFLELLKKSLDRLRGKPFRIFPTGDGAVVCAYEGGQDQPTRRELAIVPLEIAKNILKIKHDENANFQLRISINYSYMERIIEIEDFEPLDTKHIEIGNGINLAERLIHFCDPDEVVLSEEYYKVLLDERPYIESISRFPIVSRYQVFVKHMEQQTIYGYVPLSDERNYIKGVDLEEAKDLKKYAYFPPINPDIFEKVRQIGLIEDLQNLCSYAYTSLETINEHHWFVSWDTIYDAITKIPATQEEGMGVRVVSRDDRRSTFWSTEGAEAYLEHLELLKKRNQFNQFRIVVYDSQKESGMPPHIRKRLVELHPRGSLKKLPVWSLRTNRLYKYSFGVTIFPKLGCAVAPVPVFTSYNEYANNISFNKPEDILYQYRHVENFEARVFKAMVIFDHETVERLTLAFDSIAGDRALEDLTLA